MNNTNTPPSLNIMKHRHHHRHHGGPRFALVAGHPSVHHPPHALFAGKKGAGRCMGRRWRRAQLKAEATGLPPMFFLKPRHRAAYAKRMAASAEASDVKREEDKKEDGNEKPKKMSDGFKKIFQAVPIHRSDSEEAATFTLDLTGFPENQIKVVLRNERVLVIRARRKNRLGDVFVVRKRIVLNPGRFSLDEMQATRHEDGVLELQVPKKEPVKREIPIFASGEAKQHESCDGAELHEDSSDECFDEAAGKEQGILLDSFQSMNVESNIALEDADTEATYDDAVDDCSDGEDWQEVED